MRQTSVDWRGLVALVGKPLRALSQGEPRVSSKQKTCFCVLARFVQGKWKSRRGEFSGTLLVCVPRRNGVFSTSCSYRQRLIFEGSQFVSHFRAEARKKNGLEMELR